MASFEDIVGILADAIETPSDRTHLLRLLLQGLLNLPSRLPLVIGFVPVGLCLLVLAPLLSQFSLKFPQVALQDL